MTESQITVEIKFFGSFRRFGDKASLILPRGSDINAVKKTLARYLGAGEEALVADSVLADAHQILETGRVFDENVRLSILPPVCGG